MPEEVCIFWRRLSKINVLHLKKKVEVYGVFYYLYVFILQFWVCFQEIFHLHSQINTSVENSREELCTVLEP